ncbi:unnamed protein product [Umbelopsis ramanniana]
MSEGHSPSAWKLALSFTFALIVANVSGAQYVYPSFGTALAERFHWSALENSFVSTATFLGVSFSGPLCAKLVETFGIANSLRIAACFGFTGFMLLAQTYEGYLPHSFILCVFYLLLVGVGGATAYLVALDSQVHNFRAHRGLTMGMTSAAVSLCGLVFSQINDHFYKGDDDTYGFLIFMALVISVGQIAGSFTVRSFKHDHEAVTTSHHAAASDNEDDEETPLLVVPKDEEPNVSGWQFFTDPIGLSLFLALFVLLGVGYIYLAEIGQILASLPEEEGSTAQHLRNYNVSVYSLFNFASRIVFGSLSNSLKLQFGVQRIWFMFVACIVLAATLFYGVYYVTSPHDLLPCTMLIATTYGIGFGIGPAITSEFGVEVFARNWGWLLYAPAFGTQVFSLIFGSFYDLEASHQGTYLCQGTWCYGWTFVVGGACAIVSAAVTASSVFRKNILIHRRNNTV